MAAPARVYWSAHARRRAAERYPQYTLTQLTDLLPRAKRIGKKLRKKIREACPAQAKWMAHGFQGRYVLVHQRTRIVFVMGSTGPERPHVVVTVFPLADEQQEMAAAAAMLAQALTLQA